MWWAWVWTGVGLVLGFHLGVMLMSLLTMSRTRKWVQEEGQRLAVTRLAAHPATEAHHQEEDTMSQRDVERALGRLLTDEQFQRDFYQFPAGACVALGIQLTEQELEALAATPRSAVASLSGQLDDRICRLHIQESEIAR
jgi:hypothetical protein